MHHPYHPRRGIASLATLLSAGAALLGSQIPLAAQEPARTPTRPLSIPPAVGALPQPIQIKAPDEAKVKMPDGSLRALKRFTATSPGYQNVTPTPLQPNSPLGSEAVRDGQLVVLPFGSKGEGIALSFHNGPFIPPDGERIQPALAQLAQARAASQGGVAGGAITPSVYGIILLNGRFDDGTRAVLNDLGVEVLGFYPETGLLARIPTAAMNAVAALPTVRWIGQPTAAQKVHPELAKQMTAQGAAASAPLHFWVSFFGEDKAGNMRTDVSSTGARLGYYDHGIAVQEVFGGATAVQQLAAMDHVLFMEPVRYGHAMNELGIPSINADWLWGGWDPAGPATVVKVGLLDSGMYAYHTDFSEVYDGLLGYSLVAGEDWFNDLGYHGTHVSGTILGEGNGNFRYRGVAQRLVSHGDPWNNPDYLVCQVGDQDGTGWSGATLIEGMDYCDDGSGVAGRKRQLWNASLGGYGNSGSDPESRKVDEVYGHNILPCIAAGNSGPTAGTVGTPGNAKGALTVGAVYNNDEGGKITDAITSYSSRGPTGNSKYKPDVVAPGSYVDSVSSQTSSGYQLDWEGTSMATPHVTGLAAGFISHYGLSAWTTKAAIMAAAIDLGLARNTQGLGKVDAMMTHYTIDGGMTWASSTLGGTGSIQYFDFTLSHSVAQLRIVMTYPDPPCAAGATNIMVNDLDLLVQSSALGSLTTDAAYNWRDYTTEPVSVVTLNNPAAATYRIKVHGYSVPTGSQQWGTVIKVVDSALYPTLHTGLTVPYAVKPNTDFYATATAYPDAHSASGIRGSVSMPASVVIDGARLWRHGPSGDESFFLGNPPGPAYYELNHFNMGSAPQYYTRKLEWLLKGTTEGSKSIGFNATSNNSYGSASNATVIVDGTPPTIGTATGRHWTSTLHCDVYAPAQDVLAGLDVSSAWYRYSTNNGVSWSGWTPTTCTGSDGTTAVQTIICPDVPFNQNNANNRIQLYVADMAGNYLYSSNMVITTPVLSAFSLTPTTVCGGLNVTGKVTLAAAAPADGAVVVLTNANTKATVPASVTVPAGSTTATFTITTVPVTSIVSGAVTAKYGGVTKSVTLKVRPVGVLKLALSPTKVIGGYQNSTATVTMETAVPVNTTVTLSSDSASASVPASIVIAAGGSTGTFTVTSNPVALQTAAHIKATANTIAKTATLTVTPVGVLKVAFVPTKVTGGYQNATGTVTMQAPVASSTIVTLSSDNAAATVPATVTVPAGNSTATFTATSHLVIASTAVHIKAAANALPAKTATLTVVPVTIYSLKLTPTSVKGGLPVVGTVTLTYPAPAGGLAVTLGSSNPAVAAPAVASITIPAGVKTGTFNVNTAVVGAITYVNITATATGTTKTVKLTVNP